MSVKRLSTNEGSSNLTAIPSQVLPDVTLSPMTPSSSTSSKDKNVDELLGDLVKKINELVVVNYFLRGIIKTEMSQLTPRKINRMDQ